MSSTRKLLPLDFSISIEAWRRRFWKGGPGNHQEVLGGGASHERWINDLRTSKRIMRHEMLALCDCNVDKISSFRDFETLFENVKTKVEAVLPAVLAVIERKEQGSASCT